MSALSLLKQLVDVEGLWLHPGKGPTRMRIKETNEESFEIAFGNARPHGRVLKYVDIQSEKEVLVLIFNGSNKEKTVENMTAHLLRRVTEFLFREVHGVQILAFDTIVQPEKKVKLLLQTPSSELPRGFRRKFTLAWFHPTKPVSYMHLGHCEDDTRVCFEMYDKNGLPAFSLPHGGWKSDQKLSDLKPDLGVSYVSKDMVVTEIAFHFKGDEKHIWTMYLGHVAACTKLLAVVGHKIPEQDACWYDDFEFGKDPSKNIFAVYLSS